MYVAHAADDEITLGIAETHVYMWDDDPAQLADEVQAVLSAVFAGRFEERGPYGDAAVRVLLADGRRWRGGRILAPIPWRFRRRRQYEPLSGD